MRKIVATSGTSLPDENLPLPIRLALSYAPAAERRRLAPALALDQRLAGILRRSREPMLAQLRFAWWREHFREGAAPWPEGEPLLVALAPWRADPAPLAALVDGWEAMAGEAPLGEAAFLALAEGRAGVLAQGEGRDRESAWRMARNWALADIALHLSHPQEREAALVLLQAQDWRPSRLSRRNRAVAVLHRLAEHQLRAEREGRPLSRIALLAAMRAGLIGI